ncbi:melatonin receptor type 1B-A-like [Antedon mediterranea]|uniref:melatonin receptor type 1B-A-like n=1 Tax=Antedon mediterranea TaxID=105859 RepID=UPI003AF567BE
MTKMLHELTKVEQIASSFHIIFLLMFSIIGICGNSLTIIAVIRVHKLSTPTNFFIANLAVADLIVCLFVNPFYVLTIIHQEWPLGNAICKYIGFATAWTCGASLMNLAAIAINRYICIVQSKHYTDIFSKKNTILFCCLTWLLALLSVLPPLLGFGSYGLNINLMSCNISSSRESWKYMATILTIYFGCTAVIIFICYYKIFKLLKTSSVKIQTQPTSDRRMSTHGRRSLLRPSDIKIAKNLLLVSLVFAICWAPIMILSIADVKGNTSKTLWRAVGVLALANSMINPIIYAWKNRGFKQAYLQTIKCNCANFQASISENSRPCESGHSK